MKNVQIATKEEMLAEIRAVSARNGKRWGWDLIKEVSDEDLLVVLGDKVKTRSGAVNTVYTKLLKSKALVITPDVPAPAAEADDTSDEEYVAPDVIEA